MTIEHSVTLNCLNLLLNLIGHGVIMEGNRKMTGCLQTFGGHCSYLLFHCKMDIFCCIVSY